MNDAATTPAEAPATRRSFSKLAPDVRRRQLIEATYRCLRLHGAGSISVRRIAEEAGLSLGMVRHHFRSKDELLAATLRHLSDQLHVETGRAMAQTYASAMARLQAFIRACLHPESLDSDYVRARFMFWGLAQSNPIVRQAHDEIYDRFDRQIRALVADVAQEMGVTIDLDVASLAIQALLKGIWVEWSLTPNRADPLKLAEQILPALRLSFEGEAKPS